MASKTTLLALAASLTALVSAITEECGGGAATPGNETPAPSDAVETPATSKRGKPAAKPAAAGKSHDELRALIEPLVKGAPGFPGAGLKIKAIIKDLGADALKDLPAEKHDEFLAAIKPLQEELEAASI